ncbi:hypothetical protein SLE2022_292400 [Rubroshorea leprosula]
MLKLPTISVPIRGKPLKVYLSTSNKAVSALVAQDDQEGKEQPVYYHLRHYFLAYKIQLVTKSQPIWYLLTRPMLTSRLVNWLLQLSQYHIACVNPTAIKGQAVADLLFEFSDGVQYPISDEVASDEVTTCTNNTAEYAAYLIGLAMAHEVGMQRLKIVGDSSLILDQVQGTFAVREEHLAPYRSCSQRLERSFASIRYEQVPQMENRLIDTLAMIASKKSDIPLKDLSNNIIVFHELYYHLPSGILARCINDKEAYHRLREIHDRVCGHNSRISLCHRIQ